MFCLIFTLVSTLTEPIVAHNVPYPHGHPIHGFYRHGIPFHPLIPPPLVLPRWPAPRPPYNPWFHFALPSHHPIGFKPPIRVKNILWPLHGPIPNQKPHWHQNPLAFLIPGVKNYHFVPQIRKPVVGQDVVSKKVNKAYLPKKPRPEKYYQDKPKDLLRKQIEDQYSGDGNPHVAGEFGDDTDPAGESQTSGVSGDYDGDFAIIRSSTSEESSSEDFSAEGPDSGFEEKDCAGPITSTLKACGPEKPKCNTCRCKSKKGQDISYACVGATRIDGDCSLECMGKEKQHTIEMCTGFSEKGSCGKSKTCLITGVVGNVGVCREFEEKQCEGKLKKKAISENCDPSNTKCSLCTCKIKDVDFSFAC